MLPAFQNGQTPEAIVESYDTLKLADVYAVIGYYLRHPDAIARYLAERVDAAAAMRQKIESSQPARPNLREVLLKRASAMENSSAATSP